MRKTMLTAVTAALASLACAAPASAQAERALNWAHCTNADDQYPLEVAIAGCTELLNRSEVTQNRQSAYLNRSGYYERLANYPAAISDARAALRISAEWARPNIRFHLGNIYRASGDAANARLEYTRALEAIDAPEGAAPRSLRGHLLFLLDDYDGAIASFTEDVNAEPLNVRPLLRRCWARAYAGRELDLATADCNRVLELERWDKAYHNLGMIAFRQARYEDAIREYNAALQLNPRAPDTLYARGLAMHRLGREAEAETDFAAARAIDASMAGHYATLGLTSE